MCALLVSILTANERVYLILKSTVRLSHPAPMDLVLRKRISLNIYKRQSITERLKKSKWLGRADLNITQTGVTYEVVSNIPKASEELEDRESLAQLAASGEDCSACDGETYIGMLEVFVFIFHHLSQNEFTAIDSIKSLNLALAFSFAEKYTRGVSAVESILTLDRLRQSVAIKELEQSHGQSLSMRKTVSVPNFSQVRLHRLRATIYAPQFVCNSFYCFWFGFVKWVGCFT